MRRFFKIGQDPARQAEAADEGRAAAQRSGLCVSTSSTRPSTRPTTTLTTIELRFVQVSPACAMRVFERHLVQRLLARLEFLEALRHLIACG